MPSINPADDSSCLHCDLGPILDQWMRDHPTKPAAHALLELCQALAEFAVSGIVNAYPPEEVPRMVKVMMQRILWPEIHKAVQESVAPLLDAKARNN